MRGLKRPDPLHHFIATSDTLHEAAGKDNSQYLKVKIEGWRKAKYPRPTHETPDTTRAPVPRPGLPQHPSPTAPIAQMPQNESQGCLSPPQRQCPGLLQPPPARCSSASPQSSPHSPEGRGTQSKNIIRTLPPTFAWSLCLSPTLCTFHPTPSTPRSPPPPRAPTLSTPPLAPLNPGTSASSLPQGRYSSH